MTVSHDAMVSNIFKVDGGHSMLVSCLQHVASRQAPLLSVRVELQDLVTIITIHPTWMEMEMKDIFHNCNTRYTHL